MKINTELVGEKVPEKKRCPLFTIFLRARYFVYIYIYIYKPVGELLKS